MFRTDLMLLYPIQKCKKMCGRQIKTDGSDYILPFFLPKLSHLHSLSHVFSFHSSSSPLQGSSNPWSEQISSTPGVLTIAILWMPRVSNFHIKSCFVFLFSLQNTVCLLFLKQNPPPKRQKRLKSKGFVVSRNRSLLLFHILPSPKWISDRSF